MKPNAAVRVAIIDGSPRKESETRKLVRTTTRRFLRHGAEVSIFDQETSRLPLYDGEDETARHPAVVELLATVENADCIVFSSPEYHSGMSGAIKNVFDWLVDTPKEPAKLVALMGGGGGLGAAGALQQMAMVIRSFHWWLMPDVQLSIHNIWNAFEGDELKNLDDVRRLEELVSKIMSYGVWFRAKPRL